MEFSSLAPRIEPPSVNAAAIQNSGSDALSTRADTARPILASARTDKTRTSMQDDFQPLDTFEVGDRDHVPVPPEPPRQSTVLALIASAAEDAQAPDAARSQAALTMTLRDIEGGPGNPTVDIRR